jgi:organic radical activating enzyme
MIEVTRRCNIVCGHCLRGQLQNLDVKNEDISTLLSNFSYIGNITLTGGEPSLNLPAIKHFISEIKRQDIELGHFYIATNAKIVKPEFLTVLMELYNLCTEKDMCQVDVSNDYYHSLEGAGYSGQEGREMLEVFRFVNTKYQEDEHDHSHSAINEGYYAENYGDGRELTPDPIEFEDENIDSQSGGQFYMNAQGKIVSCCDLSYTSQKMKRQFQVCDVNSPDYLAEIEAYNERVEQWEENGYIVEESKAA